MGGSRGIINESLPSFLTDSTPMGLCKSVALIHALGLFKEGELKKHVDVLRNVGDVSSNKNQKLREDEQKKLVIIFNMALEKIKESDIRKAIEDVVSIQKIIEKEIKSMGNSNVLDKLNAIKKTVESHQNLNNPFFKKQTMPSFKFLANAKILMSQKLKAEQERKAEPKQKSEQEQKEAQDQKMKPKVVEEYHFRGKLFTFTKPDQESVERYQLKKTEEAKKAVPLLEKELEAEVEILLKNKDKEILDSCKQLWESFFDKNEEYQTELYTPIRVAFMNAVNKVPTTQEELDSFLKPFLSNLRQYNSVAAIKISTILDNQLSNDPNRAQLENDKTKLEGIKKNLSDLKRDTATPREKMDRLNSYKEKLESIKTGKEEYKPQRFHRH